MVGQTFSSLSAIYNGVGRESRLVAGELKKAQTARFSLAQRVISP